MLSRREIAFKYDDGINLFGTFRIIIIIAYGSLKFYLDDNAKNEVYFCFSILYFLYLFFLFF